MAIRPELLTLSAEQLQALMPYFVATGGSVIALLLCTLKSSSAKWLTYLMTLATCAAAAFYSCKNFGGAPVEVFNRMMVLDSYTAFFNLIFLACAALTAMASFRYLDDEKIQHPEYYVLLLFAAIGMMLMASTLDLIVFFIALELMSVVIYCLVSFRRNDRRCNEGAMKYFILGSAASAVLLYGAALLYGATGSLNLSEIFRIIQADSTKMTAMFQIGSWLLVSGFLFKVAIVPFHMWVPDVYEGAPTPVTGFMATGVKAAAFAAMIRVFMTLNPSIGQFHDVLWVLAVLTMVIGNVVALTQANLKRMLAYSSISHSGYLLVGLLSGGSTPEGYGPLVLYLAVYAVMNLGAFAVLGLIGQREDHGLNLSDLSGLSRRQPWLAFAMAVFLFSMAGIPPTAGFAAKYLLFYSAVQAGHTSLVVIAVLCSAISVYYYLRVLVFMYMRDPVGSAPAQRIPAWGALVVAISVALTLQVGVLPGKLMDAAKRAVASMKS